jgi:predicted nuclease of predicted toxin-antitoxin system
LTFFADEGVEHQIVERLRLDGHEVAYVAEMSPGIMDEVVLMRSQTSSSVLITADKDFGELVFRQWQSSTGVLPIRLWGLGPDTKAAVVSEAVQEHGSELSGAFAVLSPVNIRIRRQRTTQGPVSSRQRRSHTQPVDRFKFVHKIRAAVAQWWNTMLSGKVHESG